MRSYMMDKDIYIYIYIYTYIYIYIYIYIYHWICTSYEISCLLTHFIHVLLGLPLGNLFCDKVCGSTVDLKGHTRAHRGNVNDKDSYLIYHIYNRACSELVWSPVWWEAVTNIIQQGLQRWTWPEKSYVLSWVHLAEWMFVYKCVNVFIYTAKCLP